MQKLTYLEACVIGLLQGVSELFPVSSLGHSILFPALVGGSWARDLNVAAPESPYLAFIVGLHVATAIALIAYFWRDWVRVVRGLYTSVTRSQISNSEQRLAWLLVVGTIPVGLVGLVFEHTLRTKFGRPSYASVFLFVNGLILLGAEYLRRKSATGAGAAVADFSAEASDERLTKMGWGNGLLIGSSQIGALAAGISRSGITMATGIFRGLHHEDAARFSFMLATPIILAAGLLKIPDLTGPLGNGIHGQVLAGSIVSGVGAYLSVKFLTRYFERRTLTPFAIYCLVVGAVCMARFTF